MFRPVKLGQVLDAVAVSAALVMSAMPTLRRPSKIQAAKTGDIYTEGMAWI